MAMNSTISTIEILPNELFIELFQYITPYDLYGAFFNLNSRLNILIKSLQNLHLILHEDWDNRPRTIPFFASQVSILIVKHDEQIDFSSYKNLRSLKLSRPTEIQCNAIQSSYLPYLEHLSISNFFILDHSKQLCSLIFSSALSHLCFCQIDRITLDNNHSQSSQSLQQLIITPSTWKVNNYQQIFSSCPNLVYLRIIRLRNLSFQLSFAFIPIHRSIRSLYIRFYSLGNDWYKHIEWLLSILSNLESFQLIIDENEFNMEFSFDLFARLLTTYVPNLIALKVKLPLNIVLLNNSNSIKQLHSLFRTVDLSRDNNRDRNKYLFISSL